MMLAQRPSHALRSASIAARACRRPPTTRHLSAAPSTFIYDVTSGDFAPKVLQAQVPVILDCHADWCGPCKTLGPLLQKHVTALNGAVALAMLDVDAEQDLSAQLNVKSLPTVFGVWRGGVQDHFVGAKSDAEVEAFVAKMAALAGGAAPAEPAGDSIRRRAFATLIEDGDVAGAAHAFKSEYERLRALDDDTVAEGAKRKKSFTPVEFDAERPAAAEMAWCLLGLARCAVANDPPEPDAAAHLLATLRDPKRAGVLDGDAELKAAVSHLALALDGAAADAASPLAAAREAFAAGDAEGALDLALAAVRDSDDADAKEDARALVLTFIDALGAVPAATKARRKLAMYLF